MPWILLLCILACLPVQAAKLINAKNFDEIKIISAEKLNYKDGNSTLIGNVKVKLGDFIISAPRVFIDSDKDENPIKARFEQGVLLNSEDLRITAPRMEIDVPNSLFKCFADDQELVHTIILSDKPSDIYARYQEYDLENGFGRASSKEGLSLEEASTIQEHEQIRFISDDFNIRSASMEFKFADNDKIEYVDFLTNVVALADSQRIESQDLLYFPKTETIKASDTVKVLHLKDLKSNYLFADFAIYEKKKHLLSVFSKGLDRNAEIHSENVFGKSRQILVVLNEKNEAQTAILTGNAYAQHKDKSVLGHEILFDIPNQKLETIVGRPHTQILKAAKKAEKNKNTSSKAGV